MNRTAVRLAPVLLGVLMAPAAARAHVTVAGPAFAGQRFVAVFNVPHGCEGSDTFRVRVQIPAAIAMSVRPFNGDMGRAVIEKDATGKVVAVTWTRPDGELEAADTHMYQVRLRFSVPNSPFTRLYFPVVQYCKSATGTQTMAEWTQIEGEHDHGAHGNADAGAPDAGAMAGDAGAGHHHESLGPAPALVILPPRFPGWNKYTLTQHVHDLPPFFGDAQIVWSGNAAYSPNPAIQPLIMAEPGVTVLSELHPGNEIWVRY